MSVVTKAFDHYATLSNRDTTHQRYAVLSENAKNKYHEEDLPEIPAGTTLVLDFACDNGCYALADVDGVLHKVLVPLGDIHKIVLMNHWMS